MNKQVWLAWFSVLVSAFCILPSAFSAQSVTLAWDPNPENDIGGYIVYYGPASRNYTNAVNVGNVTTNTVSGLVDGATYFFAVTAFNTNGLESDFSDEVSYAPPNPIPTLFVLRAITTRSNVTLRGWCSTPWPLLWYELYNAASNQTWTAIASVGATNASGSTTNFAVLVLPPDRWTVRLCASNTANIYRSLPFQFDNRPTPMPLRLRFEVKVIESASLNGPWTDSLQAVLLIPMPVQEPQKFYQTVFNYSQIAN